jgi:hypothetical protein
MFSTSHQAFKENNLAWSKKNPQPSILESVVAVVF